MSGSYEIQALKADGSLWVWGNNDWGQLGTNDKTNYSSPVLVVGNHSFLTACTYDHGLARKEDGSIWSWGLNQYGALGNNTTTDTSSPVAVVGGHSFIEIGGAGGSHSIARKADGSCWAWGEGGAGRLGLGYLTGHRSSPTLVIGNHSFVEISVGYEFNIARKADGSCWGWGDNTYGQVGDEAGTDRSSPTLVVGNHTFIQVKCGRSHALALKADGSCWAWGYGLYGQLSTAFATSKSSPILVIGNHSFVSIDAGRYFSFGRKADGSLWGWGYNSVGQLGDNTQTSQSSPVAVVGAHSFIEVQACQVYTVARKADGSCWAWGSNSLGQLGTNDDVSYSSPVLVVGNHIFRSLNERKIGTVCWGHVDSVEEKYTELYAGNWAGDGDIIGSGNEEAIALDLGQEMISEPWETGVRSILIEINKYRSSLKTPTIYYKTRDNENDF